MVSLTSNIPVSCESDTVKFETESDVTVKLGSCGCMTNQAMPMMAMKMTKMVTTVNVRRRTKPMSEDLVGIFLVGGCSMFITLDFENKVCALILLYIFQKQCIGIGTCYDGEGDAVIKNRKYIMNLNMRR